MSADPHDLIDSDGPQAVGVCPTTDTAPVKRMRYSHEALADLIIANPFCDGLWLSLKTGYSRSWLSTIMASDAFQAKLAERREAIVDPTLRVTLEEQAKGLFARSIEVLRHKFDGASEGVPDQLAIQTFSATARALGYGNRPERESSSAEVTDHLIRHADNLVTLLRREKNRAAMEVIEVPASPPERSEGGREAPQPIPEAENVSGKG